jgi:integrase
MPLTDVACRNAICPEGKPRQRYFDSLGMYLEVTATGRKYWRLKYRFGPKEKRLALGIYPQVSLAVARRARDKARESLSEGHDPVAPRKEAKLLRQAAAENTFEAVARAWHEQWKASRTDHHTEYVIRRLAADVFPALGHLPIADVTTPRLVAMAKKIEARGALDIAKRALQTCGQIFRYAIAMGYVQHNPAAAVKPSDVLKSRRKENYPRVEPKEVPELLRKMAVYDGSPHTRAALQLIALTFVRTSELIHATWDEFDLDVAEWRIPAARMKMRSPHIVPLSRQAVDVLRCLHELRNLSPYVFPGERNHERPMSNNTILGALERLGYKHRMTGHGFRGVASTLLHEMSFPHAHIELQLAHQERNAVSASYNHATYLPERRRMMQAWADHLDSLRTGVRVRSPKTKGVRVRAEASPDDAV